MKFPEFGIKEVLAALVEGKGEHLEADDYEQYPEVVDGTILVNMPGFIVIVNPSASIATFTAVDENGQWFAMGLQGKWFAI